MWRTPSSFYRPNGVILVVDQSVRWFTWSGFDNFEAIHRFSPLGVDLCWVSFDCLASSLNPRRRRKILRDFHGTLWSTTNTTPFGLSSELRVLHTIIKNWTYQILAPRLFLRVRHRYWHTVASPSCKSSIPFNKKCQLIYQRVRTTMGVTVILL